MAELLKGPDSGPLRSSGNGSGPEVVHWRGGEEAPRPEGSSLKALCSPGREAEPVLDYCILLHSGLETPKLFTSLDTQTLEHPYRTSKRNFLRGDKVYFGHLPKRGNKTEWGRLAMGRWTEQGKGRV